MEIDDLKTGWAELERRVTAAESQLAADRGRRASRLSRRVLLGLTAGQFLQSVIWVLVIAVTAPFWFEHRRVPHLLLAGLSLHIYGVATVCSSVVQMLVIARAYYTAPVVIYQRRLAELQRLRALSSLALGLPWWILWIPATLVAARRFLGVDLYAASPAWINYSLAIGVIGMVLTVVIGRYMLGQPARSARVQRILDDVSGRSLARAIRQIDEIARFAVE